jgi:hypothetical protein
MPFARALGYGRLSVHAIEATDEYGAGEIVCAYRAGETWSSWVFARIGAVIIAWSAVTGKDVGPFPDMLQALHSVLRGGGASQTPPETN